MKKVICSRQVLPSKKPLKAILASSTLLALLLPLSAMSATSDDATLDNGERISATLSDVNNSEPVNDQKVNEITNVSKSSQESTAPENVNTGNISSDTSTGNDTGKQEQNVDPEVDHQSTNKGSVTSALDEVEGRASNNAQTESREITKDEEIADNNKSWMSLEYLLGGGLLLLLLSSGFLLFRKIGSLNDENEELFNENSALKEKITGNTTELKTSKREILQLQSEIRELKITSEAEQSSPSSVNTDASDLSLMPSLITPETLAIEDLTQSDRSQLTSIFENWLKTNRGNTKVDDLIPEHIQKKLKHWHYAIELWGQGSGLDSVDITKNTMHTAVISLIKNVNEGYAYCYIKPNSMSSLWKNKAWYTVEKVNGTLKLTGELLESN